MSTITATNRQWCEQLIANKQKLIDLGFQCRTNYEVQVIGDKDSYVKNLKYVIVHENTPEFEALTINSETKLTNIEVLGIHFFEILAWSAALDKWSSLTIDEQNELIR